MLINTHRGDCYSTPLHRLTSDAHTVLWIRGMRNMPGGSARLVLADTLHKLYPEGCGVCTDTCRLMSYLNPRGGIRDLPQPWPEYPIYVMANNPRPEGTGKYECPCMGFYDPEVGGAWRERGLRQHHPFCQYGRGAQRRYDHFVALRTAAGRPDAWFRSLKEG